MEDVGDKKLANMMFLTQVFFSGLTALASSPFWMKKMTFHTPQCQTNSKTNLLRIDGWKVGRLLGKTCFLRRTVGFRGYVYVSSCTDSLSEKCKNAMSGVVKRQRLGDWS